MGLNNDASLELHLKLDGDATDSSANGFDGTLVNLDGSDFIAGEFGQGIQFDEVIGHYISGTTDAALNFTTENFTVAFYFKTDKTATSNSTFLARMVGWGDDGWTVMFKPTMGDHGQMIFYTRAGGVSAALYKSLDADITDGWHHFAFVRTGTTTMVLYLDGVDASAGGAIANCGSVSTDWTVGALSATLASSPDAVDDVRVYSRTLAANEIRQLSQNPYNAIDQGITASISPSIAYSPATTSL